MMDRKTLLEKLVPDAKEALALLQSLQSLTASQRNWKPSPDRWSVNQCLEHINLTHRGWLKNFQPVMDHGIRSANAGSYSHGFLAGFLIRSMLPGKKSKMKTRPSFVPPSQLESGKVWDDFVALQQEWIQLVESMQAFDLVRNKVVSPFATFIRYKIGDALVVNNLHTLRHLRQAIRVTEDPGFPMVD